MARSLFILVFFSAHLACVPVNPSAETLAGRWRADWRCGVETLELRSDRMYSYAVDYAAGGRLTDSGSWKLLPKTKRLSGARVVLQNALETCSTFGEKIVSSRRDDRFLETISEYGRTKLVFNPDIQGFTRQ